MIRIVFGAADDFKSALIRWATDSDWSHVWLEYSSIVWGTDRAVHSSDKGVVVEPAVRVRRRFDRMRAFVPHGLVIEPGLRRCEDFLGRKYDYKVIWHALLLVLYRKTKWEFLHRLTTRDLSRLTCSEFVATVLKRAGVPEIQEMDPELVPPGALYQLCSSNPRFKDDSG